MGLDTSHNCWHGAYSSFGTWREDIARVLGWGTEEYQYGPSYAVPGPYQHLIARPLGTSTLDNEWELQTPLFGVWQDDPDDVIMVLMLHSDCDGIIPTRFCQPLAERLLGIANQQQTLSWLQEATEQFATGLLVAASRGEDVDFH